MSFYLQVPYVAAPVFNAVMSVEEKLGLIQSYLQQLQYPLKKTLFAWQPNSVFLKKELFLETLQICISYWENMGKAAGYLLKLPEEKLSIILVT